MEEGGEKVRGGKMRNGEQLSFSPPPATGGGGIRREGQQLRLTVCPPSDPDFTAGPSGGGRVGRKERIENDPCLPLCIALSANRKKKGERTQERGSNGQMFSPSLQLSSCDPS